MSSGSSTRSYLSTRSELPRPYTNMFYDDEMTPKASSFQASAKSKSRSEFSFSRSQNSLPSHPAVHLHNARPYSSSSLDSISTSSSSSSLQVTKERKAPIIVPPPLNLHESNWHPKRSKPLAVIEIIAPGPPRIESRASSFAEPECGPLPVLLSPGSPDYAPPSEEEQKKRRLEKVMRTLGERVPSELVYRGGVKPIVGVNVFPDPPSPDDTATPPRCDNVTSKLVRQASFTLASFPNISSVTSTLLSTAHFRSKSRDFLDSGDLSTVPTPKPFSVSRQYGPPDVIMTRPSRSPPETLCSPIVFAKILPPDSSRPESTIEPIVSVSVRPGPSLLSLAAKKDNAQVTSWQEQETDTERAAKLARRASFSTPTLLPSSPLRDGFLEARPYLDGKRRSRSQDTSAHDYPEAESYGTRPESMVFSPLVFAKQMSMILPPSERSFRLVDDDLDDEEHSEQMEMNSDSIGSRAPSRSDIYTQSDSRHGHSHSNLHLPLHPRPETPFADIVVPLQLGAPSGVHAAKRGRGKIRDENNLVVRRERRQGWSGEWNQEDMQDVIQKLRYLR